MALADGPSPATLRRVLRGVDYPTDRDGLERAAWRQRARAPEVLGAVRRLPEQEYGGPDDVLKAYARLLEEHPVP